MKKIVGIKILAQLTILGGVICFFALTAVSRLSVIDGLNAKIAQAENELKQQKVSYEQLMKENTYMKSDKFIEKIAREKLGLVYYDEIVYKINRVSE